MYIWADGYGPTLIGLIIAVCILLMLFFIARRNDKDRKVSIVLIKKKKSIQFLYSTYYKFYLGG